MLGQPSILEKTESEFVQSMDVDGYHAAIVRLATARERDTTQAPYLLFASVELITPSRPTPDSMPVNERGVPDVFAVPQIKIDLAYRRVAMSAKDGVHWYRSLQDNPTLPIPILSTDRGRFDGTPLKAGALVDEPIWPSMSTPLADLSLFGSGDDFYPTPFIGAGAHPARIHRQMAPLEPLLERLVEHPAAVAWLKRRIHFDIARHGELVAGAVLVAPDPDVREVRSFMARDAERREHLVAEVLPRAGRTLNELTLTLFEERFGAMHLFKTFTVDGSLMMVPGQGQLEQTGYSLSHIERGLVAQQKAVPYLRSISLNTSVVSRRVQVQTTDRRKNARSLTHEVQETDHRQLSVVQIEPDAHRLRDPASRFYDGAERRRRDRIARQQQLQWFENREDAMRFIRERIGQARNELMIADPFADGKDLFDFGHFATRRDLTLRLLTSRLPFRSKAALSRSFAGVLASFQERGMPEPHVRILRGGKKPPLHDRFLVIDDDVWLSGNSLNAIGERASVLIKLPASADVRGRLEKLFDAAEPLNSSVTNT